MSKKLSRSNIIVLVVFLCIAAVLRLSNLTFGFPILYVIPDEVANYQSALTMLSNKTIATFSHYPPLGSYIQIPFFVLIYLITILTGVFSSFPSFQQYLLTHEGALLFVPRSISAISGILSIWVAYKLITKLFPQKKYLGFFSLILLTFSTTHIQNSTIGKPIIPSVLFIWLFFYFLYKSTVSQKVLWYLFWAIVTLSVSTGFYFISLFFLLLYALIVQSSRLKLQQKLTALVFMLLPFVIFYISLQLNIGKYVPHHIDAWYKFQIHLQEGLIRTFIVYFKELLFTEPMLTTGFLGGLLLFKQFSAFMKKLVCVTVLYLLVFILMYWNSIRYILPIFLPMTIMSSLVWYNFVTKIKRPSWQRFSVLILLFFTILPGLTWYTRYLQTPTFIQAVEWINDHVASNQRIAYGGTRFAGFSPAYNSIKILQEKNPNEYKRLATVLQPNIYPPNVHELVYLEKLLDNRKDMASLNAFLEKYDIVYVINHCSAYENMNVTWGKKIARFSPFTTQTNTENIPDLIHHVGQWPDLLRSARFGPCFDIWEVK